MCSRYKCTESVQVRKEYQNEMKMMYTFDKDMLVNYTEKGKPVMILDILTSVSLAGK